MSGSFVVADFYSECLFCCGEDHTCRGFDHSLPGLNFREEFLEAAGILGPDFQEMRPISGDCVTFQDFIDGVDVLDKRRKMPRGINGDNDKGRDILSESLMVKLGKVSGNDLRLFKLPQSLADRRKGQADSFRQVVATRSSLFLKDIEDFNVNVIHVGALNKEINSEGRNK